MEMPAGQSVDVAGPATVNPTADDTTTVGITGDTVTVTGHAGNNGQPAINSYDIRPIDTVSVTGEGSEP